MHAAEIEENANRLLSSSATTDREIKDQKYTGTKDIQAAHQTLEKVFSGLPK